MYKKKMEEKRKCCYLLKSRTRSKNNIYILIALAFFSSRQTVDCKSLLEEVAAKQWHEKYGQSSSIKTTDKWTPLRNFKSPVNPLETMKTSETLMQPINILPISRAHQSDQQHAIQQHQQQHHQMLLQQQFLNQLAFQPTPAATRAIPELESSRFDLGVMMASCSQLPGEESQRQCQESYHQLRELESQSPPHHNLSFNIQTGFKPSQALPMQPQQHQQPLLQQQQQQQPQVAQQHLDTSASVMNLMKAPNLYHKRSSPFSQSDAIESSESDSGQLESNDNGNDESEQLSSLPRSATAAVYSNSNNDNHRGHRLRFNSNANRDESSSDNTNEDNSNHLSSSGVNQFAATNLHDTSSLTPPSPRARRLPSMRLQAQANSLSSGGSVGRGNNELSDGSNNESGSNNDEDFGAAERNEQEAAEASEAEAANREALAEQQQAQQEIIKAQAASEAKAIKEQQEALMMQQRLHQQIVLRRQHDLANNQSGDKTRATGRGRESNNGESLRHHQSNGRNNRHQQYSQNYQDRQQQYNDEDIIDRGEESRLSNNQLQQAISANLNSNNQQQPSHRGASNTRNNLDIQFSDQPDSNEEMSSVKQDEQDEVGDYSVRRPSISSPSVVESTTPEYKSTIVGASGGSQQVAKVVEKSGQFAANRTDLQPAEQHQYGSHYDSLKGHQSKYYQ